MKKQINEIKRRVIEDDLEGAKKIIENYFNISDILKQEIDLLISRKIALEKDNTKGLITYDTKTSNSNRIRLSFIKVLDRIDKPKSSSDEFEEFEMETLNELFESQAEMYYRKANEKFVEEDINSAIEYYKKSIEINPRHYKAHANLHFCYESLGDKYRAFIHKKIAVELDEKAEFKALANRAIVMKDNEFISKEKTKKIFDMLENFIGDRGINKFGELNKKQIKKKQNKKK